MSEAAAPMPLPRAHQINDKLVAAWLVRNGMKRGPVPSFHSVRLADALEATRIVQADPGANNGGGSRTIRCVVEPTAVPRLYAWAILQTEDAIEPR